MRKFHLERDVSRRQIKLYSSSSFLDRDKGLPDQLDHAIMVATTRVGHKSMITLERKYHDHYQRERTHHHHYQWDIILRCKKSNVDTNFSTSKRILLGNIPKTTIPLIISNVEKSARPSTWTEHAWSCKISQRKRLSIHTCRLALYWTSSWLNWALDQKAILHRRSDASRKRASHNLMQVSYRIPIALSESVFSSKSLHIDLFPCELKRWWLQLVTDDLFISR